MQTFLTFYPLRAFPELDSRRNMIQATNASVGNEALEQYDAGDVALVAPHFTQIWRRSPADDFLPSENRGLTERSAAFGRLDFRQQHPRDGARVDRLRRQIRDALAAAKYPVACLVFSSSFGSGELIFLWLAPNAQTPHSAASMEMAVLRQPGKRKGGGPLKEWKRLVFGGKTLLIESRPDLSNLGQ